MCNPAHCHHTLCPMKCLVLAYSTIVTISMSGLISLLVKRQTVNPSPGAVTGGKLVPSSHKRGELIYTVIILTVQKKKSEIQEAHFIP